MWPTISDMSRDECRKCLRCLELDAYGNMVSVLRAQGPYTEEKRKLLGELAKILHISNERHRAEIRRAVNDEKLSVIAEQLNGPNTYTDWTIEGRRTIPILPRLKAHTAFTGLANSLSLVIAAANEKKLLTPNRVEDPLAAVKTEPASPENSEKQDSSMEGKAPVIPGGIKTRGRKRKRSSTVYLDKEKCKKSESMETEMIETGSKSMSPVGIIVDNELSKVVQVSIVTPSSPVDTTTRTNNTLQILSTEVNSNHHKFITDTFDDQSSEETNSPVNTLILERGNDRQDINGRETIIAQSEIAKILGLEKPSDDEFLKNTTQPDESTKISRPDSTTSGTPVPKRLITNKLCVTTKPIITSSINCTVPVNPTSTVSCRLASPSVTPSKTRTYKTIPMEKLNHHSDTKMGVTLNSSRTLKINAHPNARLSSKANVIVVQKGSSRGVTLSHGGKEVLGKVIMGGNNLCLANQKGNTSVTLLPHRGSSSTNGELTLTSLASNRCENIKLGAKTGNMIMLDIRQDMLNKSTVLSEYSESVESLKSDGETLINLKNATIIEDSTTRNRSSCVLEKSVLKKNPESPGLNGLRIELSEKLENSKEDCYTNLYSIVGTLNSPNVTENHEIFETTENYDNIQVEEVLGTTTELYNCESADGIIIEDQIEESIETSGINIFGGACDAQEINLENLEYVNDGEQEIIIETSDEILEAENPFCQEAETTIDQPSDS